MPKVTRHPGSKGQSWDLNPGGCDARLLLYQATSQSAIFQIQPFLPPLHGTLFIWTSFKATSFIWKDCHSYSCQCYEAVSFKGRNRIPLRVLCVHIIF